MSTATQSMYEWNNLPWRVIERRVFKLQGRIYRASRRGDVSTVHRLQRLLVKSWSARALATRRISQDNRGKNTAGVDGVRALAPKHRLALVRDLRLPRKAQPTRRVWIPKPGKAERRPLGIPTMRDRASQALAKLALEPEWEARFEPNSYGFRPGRSCHDAIEAVFNAIIFKPKYVLDADIANCFDRINHEALLGKLHTFPLMRRAIKAWLKAGAMDGEGLFPTEEGTPQGGVISPLLANIALHGLEERITKVYTRSCKRGGANVIRYADDFVVLHRDLETLEEIRQMASEWLAGMGLELKPSKTRITHTLRPHDGKVGFDFLGFHVRQHQVGKTHTGKLGNGTKASAPLGYKTIIRPSKAATRRHLAEIGRVIASRKAAPQEGLIGELNPMVRGWANYYSTVSSKETFSTLDHKVFVKLYQWAKRRHPKKNAHWIAGRYWHKGSERWRFATRDGMKLTSYARTPIRRHVKVRETRSPYDGNWPYWASRMGKHTTLPKRVATLVRWQRGRCARCGLYFRDGDVLEVDHIMPRSLGGKDAYINWQVLHRHCHCTKTATDGSRVVEGIADNDQSIEEPDAGKPASPVL